MCALGSLPAGATLTGSLLRAPRPSSGQFGLEGAAARLEAAVDSVLDAGFRTPDIYAPGTTRVGCKKVRRARGRVAGAWEDRTVPHVRPR